MSVILDNVFVVDSLYRLTSLPRADNGIFKLLPSLSLNDEFIYTGNSYGSSMYMKHTATGVEFPLMLALFVDNNRFYYTSKNDLKSALFVHTATRIVAYDGPRTTKEISPGTIFESFENTADNNYLVKVNNGKIYQINKSAVTKIVDIEKEHTKMPESNSNETTELTTSKVSELSFERSVTLNGFTFSSSHDADQAEKLIHNLHLLINSVEFSTVNDTQNALNLAKTMGVML